MMSWDTTLSFSRSWDATCATELATELGPGVDADRSEPEAGLEIGWETGWESIVAWASTVLYA